MNEIISNFYKSEYYHLEDTFLCEKMDFYGSDKGPYNKGAGNYTKLYDYVFKDIKNEVNNLLEIGLGTNNVDVPSNMGSDGKPGASLRGFRDYFINANIYGADVDNRILFSEERIETYHVDQLSDSSLQKLSDTFDFEFDIIIDDGIHDLSYRDRKNGVSGNIKTLSFFLNKLKKGGFYIIEDVAPWQTDLKYDPAITDLVEQIKQGEFGQVEYVDVIGVPRVKLKSHLRETQIILIKK
jgi:hypothetical protein